MSEFSSNLASLASVDHLAALELYDQDTLLARIDNKPGSAGSVRVYHALAQQFGAINRAAAEAGLAIYAEHTEDARQNPGKHPNIDRLLALLQQTQQQADLAYQVKLIAT